MQNQPHRRWIVTVAAAFLVPSLAGCLGDGGRGYPAEDSGSAGLDGDQSGPPRGPVTWDIDIEDATFVDGTITIQAGDTVEWTNRDFGQHTATANNGEFDSGGIAGETPLIGTGGTFAFTFDEVGKYPYHCEFHSAMEDTITVVERLESGS